jgi:hypothetical protein
MTSPSNSAEKKSIWKPGDRRARALVKLTLWGAILVWIVFTVAMGVAKAKEFSFFSEAYLKSYVLSHWVGPIWVVFTALMFIWIMIAYVNRKFKSSTAVEEIHSLLLNSRDVKSVADTRFWRTHFRKTIFGLLILLVLSLGLDWVAVWYHTNWPILIYLGLVLAASGWLLTTIRKYERRLIDEWRKQE